MKDKPTPAFSEFMRDTDGEYSKAAILKAARTLLSEGRRADRVEMSLIMAAYDLASEREQRGRFLCNVRDWADGLYKSLSEAADRLEEKRRDEAH